MKKLLFMCLLIFILTGCSASEEKPGEYKPMVYVNDVLYGEAGDSEESLSVEWEEVGSITQKVSNIKPMVKENYTSNTLEIGTEIFGNRESPDKIYLKISESKYVLYSEIRE